MYLLPILQHVLYRIYVVGTSKDNFHIDSSDGTITTSTTLDRENVATYDDLFLKVTDGTNTATATLTINVNDINDNAPDFAASFYIGSITENAPSGMHNFIISILFLLFCKIPGDFTSFCSYSVNKFLVP